LKEHIYTLTPEESLFIGKRSEGHISNYYPGDQIITDEEVVAVQTAAETLNIDVLNTRLIAFFILVYLVANEHLISRVVY
jgi:dipeptidyl-peptidase-3